MKDSSLKRNGGDAIYTDKAGGLAGMLKGGAVADDGGQGAVSL